jgi:hypothetical protein
MCEEDIVMILFKSLSASYNFFITTLKMMPMKELTIEYVMARLMHGMSKHKEKEPQGKNMEMVARQSKAGDPPPWQDVKTCFYCTTMRGFAPKRRTRKKMYQQ